MLSKVVDSTQKKIQIVIITSPSAAGNLFAAAEEIASLNSVCGAITKIRIEDLPSRKEWGGPFEIY